MFPWHCCSVISTARTIFPAYAYCKLYFSRTGQTLQVPYCIHTWRAKTFHATFETIGTIWRDRRQAPQEMSRRKCDQWSVDYNKGSDFSHKSDKIPKTPAGKNIPNSNLSRKILIWGLRAAKTAPIFILSLYPWTSFVALSFICTFARERHARTDFRSCRNRARYNENAFELQV